MQQQLRKFLLGVMIALSVGGVLLTQGCASVNDPRAVSAHNDPAFFAWYMQLASDIQTDRQYRKIPLNTDEQANEFVQWLHDTYDHRMSVTDFSSRVSSRYPGHQYEIAFITQRLPR
ncbi:hypothetical protein [Silvimonas sp.]|uniref:hypothetical protein n=1 Tax=Silvimonas sp. TaxID=2650811 RepID=UPI002843D2AE|nr:hypothetical protein [Silvimonas sp.]MDR3430205.1 hypothetical protein [Silvimonas sp.]